jgi:hypothetical protein
MLAGQALWAQSVPVIEIPELSLRGALEAGQVRQIETYIQYYVNQMLAAKDEDAIVAARVKILDGYARYDIGDYRFNYAQMAAKQLPIALDAKDPLKSLRQINACLVVTRMPQTSIRLALEKMVTHGDTVVRYYGWQGYKDIRAILFAQSREIAGRMYQLLSQQMPKESSPQVLSVMMDVMNLSAVDMTGAADDVRKMAIDQSYSIFMANWPARLKGVADGDKAMAAACRDGANTLNYFAMTPGLSDDKARYKNVLQSLVDLMWNAATAYDIVLPTLEKAEGRAKAEAEDRIDALVGVLLGAENILNGVSGKRIVVIQTALTDARVKDKDRGVNVKLGVLDWVKEFKDAGVAEPKSATSATSTGPAGK